LSDQQEFWNGKFEGETHLYGTEPNEYIREKSGLIKAGGRVLCLGEGEGRNALFLANSGHDITALDASDIGLEKAKKLTHRYGHTIETIHLDLAFWEPDAERFDAIAASYLHLPQPLRQEVLAKSVKALKRDGLFIGEFFSLRQLGFSSGGPKDAVLLYTVEDMRTNLENQPVAILELEEKEVELHEGRGHVGPAAVIRIVFKKI